MCISFVLVVALIARGVPVVSVPKATDRADITYGAVRDDRELDYEIHVPVAEIPLGMSVGPSLEILRFRNDDRTGEPPWIARRNWVAVGDMFVSLEGKDISALSPAEFADTLKAVADSKRHQGERWLHQDRAKNPPAIVSERKAARRHPNDDSVEGHEFLTLKIRPGRQLGMTPTARVRRMYSPRTQDEVEEEQSRWHLHYSTGPFSADRANVTRSSFGSGLESCEPLPVVLAEPESGCPPLQNTLQVAGKHVLAHRGDCSFLAKGLSIRDGDGSSLIVIDEGAGRFRMEAERGELVDISVVMVSKSDGEFLKKAATSTSRAAGDLTATLVVSEACLSPQDHHQQQLQDKMPPATSPLRLFDARTQQKRSQSVPARRPRPENDGGVTSTPSNADTSLEDSSRTSAGGDVLTAEAARATANGDRIEHTPTSTIQSIERNVDGEAHDEGSGVTKTILTDGSLHGQPPTEGARGSSVAVSDRERKYITRTIGNDTIGTTSPTIAGEAAQKPQWTACWKESNGPLRAGDLLFDAGKDSFVAAEFISSFVSRPPSADMSETVKPSAAMPVAGLAGNCDHPTLEPCESITMMPAFSRPIRPLPLLPSILINSLTPGHHFDYSQMAAAANGAALLLPPDEECSVTQQARAALRLQASALIVYPPATDTDVVHFAYSLTKAVLFTSGLERTTPQKRQNEDVSNIFDGAEGTPESTAVERSTAFVKQSMTKHENTDDYLSLCLPMTVVVSHDRGTRVLEWVREAVRSSHEGRVENDSRLNNLKDERDQSPEATVRSVDRDDVGRLWGDVVWASNPHNWPVVADHEQQRRIFSRLRKTHRPAQQANGGRSVGTASATRWSLIERAFAKLQNLEARHQGSSSSSGGGELRPWRDDSTRSEL